MTAPQTLQDKIGQMLVVGFHGLEAPAYLLEWLAQGRVGGVILFGRNIDTPEQVARLTETLHKAAKYPLLISIDQEGGTVARLREGFTESPGAMALAAAADRQIERTVEVSAVLGEEMRALGINWVYAPSVDLLHHEGNPTLGTRSFGIDPEHVSAFAEAAVTGFQSAKVAACAKHFPGLGETAVDTHLALARLSVSEASLIVHDLMPYRVVTAAGVASIMSTHTIIEALDSTYPATLSPVIIQRLIRDELNFEGVVTTDCMEMKAIADHYPAGDSAILAAQAGVDMILFSHTPAMQEQAYDALLRAVDEGELRPEVVEVAASRIKILKDRYAVDAPPDLSVIRSPEHLAITDEAARAGVALLYGEIPALPERTVVVEFASALESGAVETGGLTGFTRRLQARLSNAKTVLLLGRESEADRVAQLTADIDTNDLLIVATRNAVWNPQQRVLAETLISSVPHAALLCLRTPFDAQVLPRAEVAICTCGDSSPSLDAALDVLLGKFIPTGRLPVPLRLS